MEQRFKVAGMSCGHCVRSVTEAVQEVDQAAQVQVDLPTGVVSVRSNMDAARIGAAIQAAGYETASLAA